MRSYDRSILLMILIASSHLMGHPTYGSTETPSHPTSSDSAENDITAYEEEHIPQYQKDRPQWALEVTTSLNAFGQKALISDQKDHPIYAFSFIGEYQPALLQSYGVFSIGPSFAFYPAFGSGITYGLSAILAVGGQVRYQARYFREQPIVPIFAYQFEYLKYQFQNGPSGGLISSGPTVGAWLLLNFLERSTASEMYYTNGISRSYAVLEYRLLKGQDESISFSGGSYYFGLRFEF